MTTSDASAFINRLRKDPKLRVLGLVLGAVAIILFVLIYSVNGAKASEPQPTVTTVYGEEGGQTPTAYVITIPGGAMFFCAITQGQTVYTCQQLPEE